MRISDWSSDVCSSDLHQAVFKAPEAQAAVFAWDRDTEEAHFSELGPQGFGNIAALGIVLVGDRQDFAHREFARRFLNHTLFVGEGKNHRWAPLRGTRLILVKTISRQPSRLHTPVNQVAIR